MKKILLTLIIASIIIAFATLTPVPDTSCSWDFQISFWGPAHLLVHGGHPYTEVTPYDGDFSGRWLPQLIGAFFMIGWLPCWVAAKFWFVTELAGILFIIWLVGGRKLPSLKAFSLSLLLIALFPPLYVHLQSGQIAIFIAVLLLVIIFLPKYDYPQYPFSWWIPLFLALALAKPFLGVLVYPGLLAKMYQHHGKTGAIRLILATAGWIIALMVPLTMIDPQWLDGFIYIVIKNWGVPWNFPIPYVQLKNTLGTLGIILWALIFSISLAGVLWLWLKKNSKTALVWTLALTPIATPYCSSWDFVLMLPLLVWLVLYTKSVLAKLVLIVGYLLISYFQIHMRLVNTEISDGANWWVPISLFTIFCFTFWLDHRHSNRLHIENI